MPGALRRTLCHDSDNTLSGQTNLVEIDPRGVQPSRRLRSEVDPELVTLGGLARVGLPASAGGATPNCAETC